jgi:hypothetical protein
MAAATVCGAAVPLVPVLMLHGAVLPWCHTPVPQCYLVLVDVAETWSEGHVLLGDVLVRLSRWRPGPGRVVLVDVHEWPCELPWPGRDALVDVQDGLSRRRPRPGQVALVDVLVWPRQRPRQGQVVLVDLHGPGWRQQ